MPQERTKSDNYSNFGGLNLKSSVYLTGPGEMLQSFNFDASLAGDLTGRPGSTQYFSATFANTGFLGLTEYTKLNGYSKIIVANPGGMWLGQDNTVTGISLGNLLGGQTYPWILESDTTHTNYQSIQGVSFSNSFWDFQSFVDHEFFCDGNSFIKFNGTTQRFWGLPDVIFNQGSTGGALFCGFTHDVSSGGQTTGNYYYFAYAYLNERGFLQGARINPFPYQAANATQLLYMNITFPLSGYGITALYIYSYDSPSLITAFDSYDYPDNQFFNGTGNLSLSRKAADSRFRLLAILPKGATVFTKKNPYFSSGDLPTNYVPFGQTNYIQWQSQSNIITVQERVENPSMVELFKNQLFWAGSSQNPSSVYFSDVAEPEAWEPDFSFDVRTDDGDIVTAMKSYSSRLMVGKLKSLHELVGDNPENFVLREISVDYGILNNRACCVWEGRFWFVDKNGIAEYTGILPKYASDKITSLFQRMNLTAALQTAQMMYVKSRNEVWALIPIDGSSVNNLLIVYDTIGKGWYFWNGPNISILGKMFGTFGKETPFYGDYQNRINYFGTSLMGDNGVGFTSLAQFRYESPRGKSVENFFRRLFVDVASLSTNQTLGINVNLRGDYGSSVQVAGTMVISTFQDSMNFGIPAKSLSVEVSHFSATYSIRLHGYALESRWLRNT